MADLSSNSSNDNSTDEEVEFLGYMKQYFNKLRRPYFTVNKNRLFK